MQPHQLVSTRSVDLDCYGIAGLQPVVGRERVVNFRRILPRVQNVDPRYATCVALLATGKSVEDGFGECENTAGDGCNLCLQAGQIGIFPEEFIGYETSSLSRWFVCVERIRPFYAFMKAAPLEWIVWPEM